MGISFDHSAVPHIMCISYTVLSKGQSLHLSNFMEPRQSWKANGS